MSLLNSWQYTAPGDQLKSSIQFPESVSFVYNVLRELSSLPFDPLKFEGLEDIA